MVAADAFLEWADVFGNLYGTCAADVERDLARAATSCSSSTSRARGRSAHGSRHRRRLRAAAVVRGARAAAARTQQGSGRSHAAPAARRRAHEVAAFAEYDYVIVNDELEACVERLRAIVLAERSRLRSARPAGGENRRDIPAERVDSEADKTDRDPNAFEFVTVAGARARQLLRAARRGSMGPRSRRAWRRSRSSRAKSAGCSLPRTNGRRNASARSSALPTSGGAGGGAWR